MTTTNDNTKTLTITAADYAHAQAVLNALTGEAGTTLVNAANTIKATGGALMAHLYAVAKSAMGEGDASEAYYKATLKAAESAFREERKHPQSGIKPSLEEALGDRYAYYRSVKSRALRMLKGGYASHDTLAAAEKAMKADADKRRALTLADGKDGKAADGATNPTGGAVAVNAKWGPMLNRLAAALNALPFAAHDDAAKELDTLAKYFEDQAAPTAPTVEDDEDQANAATA